MSAPNPPVSLLPRSADPAVVSSIRQAAQTTGSDFGLLMAEASRESGFQPDAKASTSTATGLYQFIETTWLEMVRRFGGKYGVGALAEQVSQSPSGRPQVADPATRQQILDLRKDPRLAAALAGEYTRVNKDEVERQLGHAVSRGDLYVAHFLGAGGAAQLLRAVEQNGNANAAQLLPEAAAANHGMFYDAATGAARTVGEIYRSITTRIEKEARVFAGTPDAPASETAPGNPPPTALAALAAPQSAGLGPPPLNPSFHLSAPLLSMLDVMSMAALELVRTTRPLPAPSHPPGTTTPPAAESHERRQA